MFCRITPHIEDNKNIIIDFIQDIPGLQERIIYDRREMVQSYTEKTAITNKRIPNNKTLAFACDIRKVDQDNQTASPAEKKTLIVLIKPTIIVQEEMPRREAAAMIFNSPRPKGDTAKQADDKIYLKPVTKELSGTDKNQIMIDIRILKVSDEFMGYIGLNPDSVAKSKGWSDYLVDSTDDSASFVIDQLHEDLLLGAVAARMRTNKDIRMLSKPQVLAKSGKKCEIHITDSEYYMLRAPTVPNGSSEEPLSKSNRLDLGTTIRMIPTLTTDGKDIELDFEWEYRRLRGFKEHTGPDGKVQKVPQVDVDSIKMPCTIPDGKTLLIAGMKIIEQVEVESKTPILNKMPLVGRFFHNKSKITDEITLLIMVTPRTYIKKPLKPQTPRSLVDPNDPLIKKLEEKFKRETKTTN
jgi:type II secretory pathway component GspD/PulD (secretin)